MKFVGKRNDRALPLAALLLSLLVGSASADEFHYNTTLIGDRPAGMGGAYTAVSDDAAGLYYNPAGAAYTQGTNLSASANAYATLTKTYQGTIGSYDWKRNSETIQPNFFGVIQHTQFGTVGFSYAIPDSMLESQDQAFANPNSRLSSFTINFNKDYNLYNAGPSYANDLSADWKMGITLYYHYKRQKTINNYLQLLNTGEHVWNNTYFKLEEFGVRPVVGILWSPENGKFSMGFTVSKTFLYNASQFVQITTKDERVNSSGVVAPASSNQSSTAITPEYPYQARLGVAWFPSSSLLLSADAEYTSSVKADSAAYSWDRIAVLNYALGVEYYPLQSIAMRAGFFTDFANTNNAVTSNEKVDLIGVTLSVAWFSKSTSISAGVTTSWGSGQQWVAGQTDASGNPVVGSMSERSLTGFIGTSYSY